MSMCPGVQLLDESWRSNFSAPFFLKNLANVRSRLQALTCDTSFSVSVSVIQTLKTTLLSHGKISQP